MSDYCRANCSRVNEFNDGWEWFCNRLDVGFSIDFDFRCSLINFSDRFHVSKICDGVIDWDSQADVRSDVQDGFIVLLTRRRSGWT